MYFISRLFPKESLQYLDPVIITSSVPEEIIQKVRIRSFDSIDVIDEPHYGEVRHVSIHQHQHRKDTNPDQQQDLKHKNNYNDTNLSLGGQNNENIMNRYSIQSANSNRHNHSHPVNAIASTMLVGGFEENSSMASSTLFPTNP